MKQFCVLAAAVLFTLNLFSQTIYTDRRDGEIYFKFADSYKLNVAVDEAGYFSKQSLEEMMPLFNKYGVTAVRRSFYFAKEKELRQVIRIYFINYHEIDAFLSELKKLPFADYAEHVPYFKKSLTPNDLGTNSFNNGRWHLYKISAQQAWDISTGSTNVKIAIVDDAVQTAHPDLAANMLAGRDVADGDNDPNPPTTAYSHGTHVAGCASAVTNNNAGIASIGYSVKIIPVKSTNSASSITDGYEGVTWAYSNGANVINMSWGSTFGGTTGNNIMNAAYNAGVTLVGAAGNDGVSTTYYPAGYTNVIAVASTTSNDAKSSFSNYGTWVDVSAPGSSIRSTVPTSTYATYDGTSMASPITAGLCGLVLSVNPSFTPTQVRNCVTTTADNINSVNSSYVGQLGGGRINAYQALVCAQGSVVQYDAGIQAINTPSGSSCSNTFTPQVVLKNFGSNTLTSVTIQYRIDNGTIGTFNWTGSLAAQGTATVNLPAQTTTTGAHTFTANTTTTVNGSQTDANANNNSQTVNFTLFGAPGLSLPFSETFESNSLSTNNWTIDNPDNSLSWELITTAGTTPGSKSVRIPFFSYETTGQRDGLITPPLNFTGFDTVKLRFDHAYRRFNTSSSDSLIIYVSTNCGSTWTRIFARGENGTGVFATTTTSQTEFVPNASSVWCTGTTTGSACYNIDLSAYKANNAVRIKFEGYNNYGNNLYLDNINVIGVQAGSPPVAGFNAAPVAVCQGDYVSFTNQSTNQPTSYAWSFPGGNPAISIDANPSVRYDVPGTYNVTLTALNGNGQNSVTKTQYVTVYAKPDVTGSYTPQTVCNGDEVTLTANGATSYQWTSGLSSFTGNGIPVTISGNTVYNLIGTDGNGCKDTTTVNVTSQPRPNATVSANSSICNGATTSLNASGGNSYAWSNNQTGNFIFVTPTQTTTYVVTVSLTGSTCTDTASVTVQVVNNVQTQLSQSICSNGAYTFDGQQLTIGGQYTATYPSAGGCDSIVTLNLTVNDYYVVTLNESICSGSSYTFNGQQLTTSGPYSATYQTVAGCDSVVNLNLTVSSVITNTLNESICAGSSYTFNGQTYTTDGSYSAHYTTLSGCDSTVTLNLTLNAEPTPSISQSGNQLSTSAYSSFQWQLNGVDIQGEESQNVTITQNGNYTVVVTDANGCEGTSASFTVTGVGINDVNAIKFMVYPNPANATLVVEAEVDAQVAICDYTGKVIERSSIVNGKTMFDVSKLASAVYFVEVKAGNKTARTRFVKL